ncbi:hypothetical protein BH160DRAFT_1876 [Burkholderia sp. H160]|nr:hypothetical protein BH160DRAFT_1876 [Burkholderia sp. H160]
MNSVAYPACGLTITYTYIFLEEIKGAARQAASTVGSRARALVARTAYPGLVVSAKRFRRFHKFVAWAGAAITLLAAILLWLVVYGVQLTSRFEENQKTVADVTNQIYAQVDKENAALPPDKQTHETVPARCHADRIEQQSKRELFQPRSHRVPEAPRVGFVLEADNDVIRSRSTVTWCRSAVNRSFFRCLAACRTRSSPCGTLARF